MFGRVSDGMPQPLDVLLLTMLSVQQDEGGSEFVFTQDQVNALVKRWLSGLRPAGHGGVGSLPNSAKMTALDICISE